MRNDKVQGPPLKVVRSDVPISSCGSAACFNTVTSDRISNLEVKPLCSASTSVYHETDGDTEAVPYE